MSTVRRGEPLSVMSTVWRDEPLPAVRRVEGDGSGVCCGGCVAHDLVSRLSREAKVVVVAYVKSRGRRRVNTLGCSRGVEVRRNRAVGK